MIRFVPRVADGAGLGFVSLGFLLLAVASADEPLPARADKTVYSLNKKFYAFLDAHKKRTTVHQANKRGTLWEMPGWFRVAALSNDGDYLVETVEKRTIAFDVATGKPIDAR